MTERQVTEQGGRPGLLAHIARQVRSAVRGFGRRASDEIRNHPAETVAAAAACGVMVALALRPSRRANRASTGGAGKLSDGSIQPGDWNL
jgi:hypothetical protein